MHLTPKFTFYSRVSDTVLWSKGTATAVEKGNCNINISRRGIVLLSDSRFYLLFLSPSIPVTHYSDLFV